MKLKLLSCLLAASVMLSVQPFKVINNTTKNITLDEFGLPVFSNLDHIVNTPPWVMKPDDKTTFPPEYTLVTFFFSGEKNCPLQNLTAETTIVFTEIDGYIAVQIDDKGPFKTDILVSNIVS